MYLYARDMEFMYSFFVPGNQPNFIGWIYILLLKNANLGQKKD